jgi:hypothetical protein
MTTQTVILIAGLLTLPLIASAQGDLERLKASYEKAVTKAVEPLKATYEAELRKLLERHAQAGRLDDVAKVMAELNAIGVTDAEPTIAGQTPKSRKVTVESTTWKTPTGTEFSFEPGGKGTRSFGGADATAITWRERSGGNVEVTGAGSKGENEMTWYFRFVSETEAYYGNSKDDVTKPLQKQR